MSLYCSQGCQFLGFSLSDFRFFEKKENGIKLIKYGQNKDKIAIVPDDRLNSGKGVGNPYLKTVLVA